MKRMKRRIEGVVLFLLLSFVGIIIFSCWEEWKLKNDNILRSIEMDIEHKILLFERKLYYERARKSLYPFPALPLDKRSPLTITDLYLFS